MARNQRAVFFFYDRKRSNALMSSVFTDNLPGPETAQVNFF